MNFLLTDFVFFMVFIYIALWVAGGKTTYKKSKLEIGESVGSVGCWWAVKCFTRIFCYIITGAFTNFAIFENRIFF